MGLLKSAADTYYAYRILKLLSSKWEDTPAYKAGIIDSNGYKIVENLTDSQKNYYSYFDRIVYNLKRIMNKVPMNQNPFVRFGTAILLLKESDLTEEEVEDLFDELDDELVEEAPVNVTGANAYSEAPLGKKKIFTRSELS